MTERSSNVAAPWGAEQRLILASSSPRRRQLMQSAGYVFDVVAPDASVECGVCSSLTPPELVARLAFRKAEDVMRRVESGMIIAADTVASCRGQILGKPADREHARRMLQMLSGTEHAVWSGLCLWSVLEQRCIVDVSCTQLSMQPLDGDAIESYLDTNLWQGKAGAFGYQDGNDWLRILEGSASNVVGLPMERLTELLQHFDSQAQAIDAAVKGNQDR
ncbi:MAG: Maf family protein [Pirellulaceae bacterium]